MASPKQIGIILPAFLLVLVSSPGLSLTPGKEKLPATYTIPLPPPTDFSSLEWLVGEWTGKTQGRSVPGEIHLTVTYELEKRFMVFREEISFPSSKAGLTVKESWMGILSANPSSSEYTLRQYSTTGFITRYRVTVDKAEIRFHPEGGEQPAPGWLFRRVIQRNEPTALTEIVQAAPPDKPFFDYYTATLDLVGAAKKPPAAP